MSSSKTFTSVSVLFSSTMLISVGCFSVISVVTVVVLFDVSIFFLVSTPTCARACFVFSGFFVVVIFCVVASVCLFCAVNVSFVDVISADGLRDVTFCSVRGGGVFSGVCNGVFLRTCAPILVGVFLPVFLVIVVFILLLASLLMGISFVVGGFDAYNRADDRVFVLSTVSRTC